MKETVSRIVPSAAAPGAMITGQHAITAMVTDVSPAVIAVEAGYWIKAIFFEPPVL
ncbi:hypothetical protein M4D58_22200 [Brevibacillus borstelensis]|uniref:hypothetical protein n=1 Tax=Brevibacillus borstelensis TaxID=45462 RepID=UPI00203DE119|nr:hypothetical protein [Brevibacillus borstelensis]MCM3593341.1 hypothetical protein [Brevibacillus borstelensis]